MENRFRVDFFHFLTKDGKVHYNPLQNLWHKVKKSSKLEQDFKNLLHNFACFFTAIVKV